MTDPTPPPVRRWGVLVGLILALFSNQVYMYFTFVKAPNAHSVIAAHEQLEAEVYGKKMVDLKNAIDECRGFLSLDKVEP